MTPLSSIITEYLETPNEQPLAIETAPCAVCRKKRSVADLEKCSGCGMAVCVEPIRSCSLLNIDGDEYCLACAADHVAVLASESNFRLTDHLGAASRAFVIRLIQNAMGELERLTSRAYLDDCTKQFGNNAHAAAYGGIHATVGFHLRSLKTAVVQLDGSSEGDN